MVIKMNRKYGCVPIVFRCKHFAQHFWRSLEVTQIRGTLLYKSMQLYYPMPLRWAQYRDEDYGITFAIGLWKW